MAIRTYADLDVWRRAVDLAVALYEVTARFPKAEVFGLTAQLRRAGVSVPSNIAEGHSRKSTAEFLRHISIALGSLSEIETQLVIARRLGYLDEKNAKRLDSLCGEIGPLLGALYRSLSSKRQAGSATAVLSRTPSPKTPVPSP
jgi:four helix bundle protein